MNQLRKRKAPGSKVGLTLGVPWLRPKGEFVWSSTLEELVNVKIPYTIISSAMRDMLREDSLETPLRHTQSLEN